MAEQPQKLQQVGLWLGGEVDQWILCDEAASFWFYDFTAHSSLHITHTHTLCTSAVS